MVKRRRLNKATAILGQQLSHYWHPAIWQTIWHQSQRQRWRSLVAEVTFLWLLGLLGASFALLQFDQQAYFVVPQGALQLARGLQQLLAIPAPPPPNSGLGWPVLVAIVFGAGLCLVAGTEKLTYTLATIYQGAPSRRRGWLGRLWPLLMTTIILLTLVLASSLTIPAGPASPAAARPWLGLISGVRIAQLLRSLVSLSLLALGLGLVHRLSPRQWLPTCPLWPGVGLTFGLGLGVWILGQGGIRWIQSHPVADGLLLILIVGLITLYGLVWLVPVGAQFNVCSMGYDRGPGRLPGPPRTSPPPPSFESFKIHR